MFRLAGELRAAGWRVITSTTTHISLEQAQMAPVCIRASELDNLEQHLDRFGHCLIVGPPDGKGRVTGIPPELISELKTRNDVDAILVEADGSKSLPFKAPGAHEPVIPEATTILVPIMGLNVLGRPLNDKNVHRPEIIARLSGTQVGDPVTTDTIARVLSHPEGGGRHRPPWARLIPLLNKADGDEEMGKAAEIAERLLKYPAVDSALISSMLRDFPVREAWTPAAGVILAAGKATRYGTAKQTLPWQDRTLAAHAVRTAIAAGLDPVIAVLGHEAETVEKSLAGLPVQIVFNPEYAAGQSTSLRKGMEALPARTGAALFLLADQPLITAAILKKIVQAHRKTLAPACVPVFEERRGNPVLFDRALFGELTGLRGDTGGRALLEKYRAEIVEVPAGREVLLDIDTPADYAALFDEPRIFNDPRGSA
jgi:molybdenum cofactor cytidylyltransferase